ncbi:MAG: hypothetical protein HON32_04810 [Francisellaceae bacterium]|nr:hypothetical protein [Francisellaceae bacterium]MBT6539358.1 hypothetical protein [Francisellaceae bacterium]
MKFSSYLSEATLLRRPIRFLAEVALPSRQKLVIRCPNLGRLLSCDILGTRLWFSNPTGLHCLPTWELAEVDSGHIVGINPELVSPVFKEGVKNKSFQQLIDYDLIYDESNDRVRLLRLENKSDVCYVGLEHVTLADDNGVGYFPESPNTSMSTLKNLIKLKRQGHEVKLCFCALHTGVKSIRVASHISSDYYKLLQIAINEGIEILAYRAIISIYNMELSVEVPILMPEKIGS